MSYVYVVLARSPSYHDDYIYDKKLWYESDEYAILGIYSTLKDAEEVYYNPNLECTDKIVELIYMPFNNKRFYWNNKIKSRYVYPEADTYYMPKQQSSLSRTKPTKISEAKTVPQKAKAKSEPLPKRNRGNRDMELRKITYGEHTTRVILPRDYHISDKILEEDMQYARDHKEDLKEALNEHIVYSLGQGFWDAIKAMELSKSIFYMFAAIKNSVRFDNYHILGSFQFSISEVDSDIIDIIAKQPADDYEIDTSLGYKLQTVANVLAHRYHSSVTPKCIDAAAVTEAAVTASETAATTDNETMEISAVQYTDDSSDYSSL